MTIVISHKELGGAKCFQLHFLRIKQEYKQNRLTLEYVITQHNLANLFTNDIPTPHVKRLRKILLAHSNAIPANLTEVGTDDPGKKETEETRPKKKTRRRNK